MKVTWAGFSLISGVLACGIYSTSVNAQVIPDATLKTTVLENGNNFTITDGNRVGNNLFHSFSQFSIPSKGSAFFNNASDIQNIFSRVTGGSISNIDGLIQANGSANLFLLNPSGIIFGQNASLNIGGSFVGTTANSIKFADGVEFSATNPSSTPLLTMSVPIGLQMGSNPGAIAVQGRGHALTSVSTIAPITQNPSASELRVKPGKTLALVGGNLNLTGATLNAPQGRVELGSLSGVGMVSLNPISQGYQLGYESGQSFADIQLTQKSLLTIGALPTVGALNAGSVQLQGKHIQISDGSIIYSKNLGNVAGGEVFLQASEGIDIVGTTANAQIRSGIRSEGLNTGTGSPIHIITPHLTVSQGAGVNNNAFGFAASGDIQIDAGTVELSGFSSINPTGVTALTTTTRTGKSAGNLSINSNNLVVSGGAAISSVTFATGSTGQVTIRSQSTTVTGDNPAGLYSNISAITYGTGNAQTLTLDTKRLQLLNGGAVATTSFLIGEAGNLNINATESILIDGRSQTNNSSINSAVLSPPALLQQLFNLPKVLSANAGTVNINTPTLTLSNGGAVSVTNQGTGNGGDIKISANKIFLDTQGSIQAQTASGEGGNITSQVSDVLLLRHNSLISATSAGNGNGGNININTPILVGLENSDIIANAFKGKGGNIDITTQDIIGLEFRDTLTPREDLTNDITASSQFSINGNVEINNVAVDPNSGLIELPANLSDSSQQIASACSGNQGSSFVATGRGGIPQNPNQDVKSDTSSGLYSLRTWSDVRDISAYQKTQPVQAQIPQLPETLVQATGWYRNAQGKIQLVADKSSTQMQQQLTCAAIPQN
ncbi:filamentous hemagglutinin N-terminal domain-containing protein [Calothrix sp. PCC 6303]|uniref:two-partner secretion domain-containing protein n=1 Tax=Calothrix sp. PCC 6303 TaxID=1170562 RepID=UPI0002A00A1F|nr:S-layer family protein [Calothrix sp. PCC 6303]AFZ02488.1 filamentous hemagglutinin family outer membrane protein [Calothrix sp. PCC 6303]